MAKNVRHQPPNFAVHDARRIEIEHVLIVRIQAHQNKNERVKRDDDPDKTRNGEEAQAAFQSVKQTHRLTTVMGRTACSRQSRGSSSSGSPENQMGAAGEARSTRVDTPVSKSNLSGVSDAARKITPLYGEHMRFGAKLVPFGGWLMPLQYSSILNEHQAVRNNVGMFDISHMGQLIAQGSTARTWLNTMMTNNIEKLGIGQGQYTFLLNNSGGIIDDLIAYRICDDKFLLVVNASCTDDDFTWLRKHVPDSVKIDNRSTDFGGVAIQGPRGIDLFRAILGKGSDLPPRNHIVDLELEGMKLSIARTGYTGEDGVEVFFLARDAVKFWSLGPGERRTVWNQTMRPWCARHLATRDVLSAE